MAKFKVLVIGLSLKNNKVAKFGDIVEESQLSSDVESLVKGKYIELVSKKEDLEVKEAETTEKVEDLEVKEAETTEKVEDLEVKEAETVKPKKDSKK